MEPLTIDVVDSDGGFRVNHVPLEDRRLAYEHPFVYAEGLSEE